LATRIPVLRPHPLRTLCLTFALRRQRILRRWSRRVRGIGTQRALQRRVLRLSRVLRLKGFNPSNQTPRPRAPPRHTTNTPPQPAPHDHPTVRPSSAPDTP
jgi:hypothetical protein